MSAKYAVLGLLVERPGYGYQLAQRLEERFGSCGFAPSGVYSALGQLSRDQLVRSVREVPGSVRRGAKCTVYEATDEGVTHFEVRMCGSSPAPPLRDELHIKIGLCRPRNASRLIDSLYGQELACAGRLRGLELLADQDAAREIREWPRLMRALATEAEVAMLAARIEWLRAARERLERLREEARRSQLAGGIAAGGGRMARLHAY